MFTRLFCFPSFLLRALRCFVVIKEFFAIYLTSATSTRTSAQAPSPNLNLILFQPFL